MKSPFSRRVLFGATPKRGLSARLNFLTSQSNRVLLLLLAFLAMVAADAPGQQSNPLRITCPPNRTNWHCGVASTAIVTYPVPTTTGSCPTNAVVTCTPPSGAVFILGTTPVTCRATNSCRESVTCTFTVTVARDTTPPIIQCPPNRTNWLCSTAVPDARVFWPPPTATDNADTNVAVTCSPPSGSLFPPGITTVTCTATDDCTNRATCTFTVTVIRDLTPPVITCPASINVVSCSASGAVVSYPVPAATDNADPNVAVTCSPPSGSLFPVGTTTVTCTATDECTNRTTCTFLVRVTRDTTPPVLQPCPSNRVVLACDRIGAVVNYPTPTATDNFDPSPSVVCLPPAGSQFPVGVTTVTCTATDDCTNRSSCLFTIAVNADTTPPVIQCPSNIVLWTCSTSAITHYAVTATDDYDLDVKIACTPPAGTPLAVGNTIVRCVAEDDCGNTNQCSFQVQVNRDTTPPAIECPSNMVFNCLCPGNTIVLDFFKPTVTDNHDPNPTVVCVPPSLVSSPGVHPVTCTATDNCGNSNRCSFTVTFNYDTVAPAVTCPTNMTVWTCNTTAVVNYSVSATDTCDASVDILCTPPSGSVFPLGVSTVACIATDNCTNRSTCTFTVTVNRDTTPPAIICPTNVVASICSTCAVSQCVANVPPPIRPASVGNGLFYSASVEPDLSLTQFNSQVAVRAEDGYHPIHVNAYQPPGATGVGGARFAAAWVRDDDSAFPFDHGWFTTADQLQNEAQAQEPLRPISLSGYRISPDESRFAVAYLRDDSGYPWQLILDHTSAQYQAAVEALADQGFRPISVSGYSFQGQNPRFSAILVQDGLTGSDWVTAHGIPESDYQSWFDGWWDDGFRPISLSGYTVGNETFFTAVMVRVPGSGGYVARHGLTENEFLAENANWTNPANNEFNTAFRPVVVAAYRSGGNAGQKRYAAVWRGSAPRAFAANGPTQPSLAALDTAMQSFMQSRDINAATLCVSKDGGIVHHRGYTWAPGEFKETQPCSRFRIASASKAVTALAIMKLLEGNIITGMKSGGLQALTLDTPVFQINGMPNLPAAYGAEAQNITIRHLLQHRAGWDRTIFEPLYSDLTVAAALGENLPMSRQDMIDYMMTPGIWPTPGDSSSVGFPGLFPPGTISAYSNFGFSVLAELIEVISNQSYENYLRTEILLPVNANRTRLGRTARLLGLNGPDEVTYTAGGGDNDAWYVSDSNYTPGDPGIPTSQSRVGLSEPGAAFPTTAYGRYNIHTIDAAGGWVTTSDDMVRLLKSFDAYDPAQLNSDTPLLDWDSIWEMWSNPANITQVVGNNYVLGWQQTTLNTPAGNVTVLFHGGNVDGAMAVIGRRSDGVTFAAMMSREAGSGLFTALNNAINSITSWPVCPDGTIVNYTPPIATDNADANVSVVCVPPSGSYFPIGFHSVTCTATDDCGNQRTCQFRVTVKVDNTPPSIQCPTNRVVWTCSTNGAVVSFPPPNVDDDTDPNPSVVCVPPSGSLFPVGRSVVTCTATDDCTNRSTCTFTVTVNADTVPPVIDCPSNIVLWTCSTSAITHYAVTATDNHDRDVAITCVPPGGTPLPVGDTTVNCTARDDCGNSSQCSFRVRVIRDTTPPEITCPSNMVFNCLCPGAIINLDFFQATATDDQDQNPIIVCNPPSLVSSPGVHVVTCTATDNCGNSNRCSFTVTFNYDTTPPVITCPANLTAWTCNTSAVVNFSASATDTCDANVGIVCTPRSGSVFPLGTTTVACTATDNCTNRSTCTFTVTVNRSPETGAALDISLQRGQIVVNWDERTTGGVLQTARDPGGPWFDVTGATAPYTTRPVPGQRFYRLNHCPNPDPAEPAEVESFSARAEADLGTWLMLPQSDWMFTRGQTWTHIRSGARPSPPVYRSMSGHFLVPQDDTPIAVFFSAEAYVDGPDKRLFVRALVDGEPLAPGDVVFATGVSPVNPESRAFVFTGRASAGLHTVEMQWLVDPEGTGYIRDAAYLVRVGDSPNSDGSVQVFTPPSGPSDSTTVAAWSDVPGLSGVIQTKAGESLAISVSAESFVIGGGTMFLRALVDGAPAKPSDVLFAKGSKPQCRLMTFGMADPSAGLHNVRIQWQAGGGGAFVGDRSLVLAATPNPGTTIAQAFVAPDSGAPESTSSTEFAPMPGMSATGKIPPNGEVAVLFSAVTSVPADESLHVRLTIDGVPVPESEVQLAESDVHTGVHSFVFSAKHLYAGAPPPDNSTVRIEWRVAGGNPVFLDDRSLTVLVKKPSVPDLAEPRPFGLGNFPIESAIGARRLLVILWDPHRPGHTAPTVAAVQQAVFGPADSIRHYYSVVSREKYSMNSALGGNTVLGWYDAAGPVSDYFDNEPDCLDDGTANGQDRRRAEALTRAAQDIDFASFDDNRDGVLDPQLELGILLIIPDTSPSDGKVRNVRDANCDWLTVGGVIVPLIAEWMTDASSGDFMIGAHELAHMMLNLDDNYLTTAIDTEAGRLSLMELFNSNHTPHPEALNKLALGWISARRVHADGLYSLTDVKQGGDLLILPRAPGKATDEYVLLENRQSAADDQFYDRGLGDSGVAVWHIIEGNAENAPPPECQDEGTWNGEVGNGNARRGNRLVRPLFSATLGGINSLWHSAYYDLLDGGAVCPDDVADPAQRRNILRWADGTASGYSILNWSAAAETMTFQVLAP